MTLFGARNESVEFRAWVAHESGLGEFSLSVVVFLRFDDLVVFVDYFELSFFAISSDNSDRPHGFGGGAASHAHCDLFFGAFLHEVDRPVQELFLFNAFDLLFVLDATLYGLEAGNFPPFDLTGGVDDSETAIHVSQLQIYNLGPISPNNVTTRLQRIRVENSDPISIHYEDQVSTSTVLHYMGVSYR